jgi:signal transduction histidine kinase/DNA-binding response OmpR family regulator/streptogramin lyase
MWVGTYFGGANVKYSSTTDFTIYQHSDDPSSLSNNVVSSIVEDEDHNLWVGTEGGGLNYYNRLTGKFTAFKNKLGNPESLGSNLVKVVYLDRDGNPWIGTHGGGLNVMDRRNATFKRYLYEESDPATLTREVTSILEDRSSRFWVATYHDLKVFRRRNTSLEPVDIKSEIPSFPNVNAISLFEDNSDIVWLSCQPGLYVIKDNTIKTIDSSNDFNCVYQDGKGRIWVGVAYGGLASYDAENERLRYHDLKLINNNVVGILDDTDGNLWLSTDNGLVKFNPENENLQTYTMSDGLAGDEFNFNSYLKDSRGEIFFGGFNGMTSFFTHNIETNRYAAPIVITGLKLFNKDVEINGDNKLLSQNITLAQQVTFKHNQDVFAIEFALLNYIKSEKNKYAYKLEGFDKHWNEVTNTSATYTSLPAGSYKFTVKGTNNDGVESQPASLKIKILPPFWLTWWAYSIYVIVMSAITFLLLRYFFLQALLKKEDELHQVKLNFFTNISHEIRTHLTLILAPVDRLIEQKEKGDFDRQQLTNVKSYANRLLTLVNELMDFRKAETRHLNLHVAKQNLIPFLQEIYTSFQQLSIEKNITTSFTHDAETIDLYFDRQQLEKVFFNLLTNAFKFTPSGGRIEVHVGQEDKKVVVSIEDNGRGIAPEYIDKLFGNFFQVEDESHQNTGYGIGLALSKSIIDLHKGTITVESDVATNERQSKTIFTVTLLKGSKHFEDTGFVVSDTEAEQESAKSRETQEPIPLLQPTEEISHKQFTLLVVEDNAELRKLAYQTFISHYRVLLSEDGLQGWDKACEEIPDLIISDVMMPGMDGFSLCNKLKTDPRTSHIPVILLTAKSSQTDLVSGLEMGADVYLTKPFSPKALALNVRNLLSSREKIRQKFSSHINEDPQQQAVVTVEAVKENFVNSVDREFLSKVIQLVDTNIDNPEFGVDMLSREVGMSAPILYKKIKAVTDMSVNEFVKSLRLKKAAQLLLQKKQTVYEVAYAVGYSDRKYFSKEFKKHYGKTPSEYAGETEKEQLEAKVEEKTLQFERTFSDLDFFLYRSSHDFKRPISTLMGLVNLMGNDAEEKEVVLRLMNHTLLNMDSMLLKLQMIHLVNLEKVNPEKTNVTDLTCSVLQKIKRRFPSAPIEFISDSSVHASVDVALFEMIALNLLENSIQFLKKEQTGKVECRLYTSGDQIVLSVRDNGIGIPGEIRPKVFDLFFRGTEQSNGNGLGLYITEKAVRLMKGSIELTSDPGQGTHVSVRLPSH